LNIPPKPIPTADNEKLYEALREKVLKMFSLQKHAKKKEMVYESIVSLKFRKRNVWKISIKTTEIKLMKTIKNR
jgi:hypothetical protein